MEHYVKTPHHGIQDGFQVCGFSVCGLKEHRCSLSEISLLKHRIFSVFLLTTNLFQKIKVCVTLFVLLNVLLSTFGNTEVTIFMSCIYATQYRTNKLWFMHRHMWTTQKTARMKRLDCYSQKWQWQVNCYSELGPKIYDWMIMACLIVATAVCVPWQDKHVLTVAMQSVAQCVTYQIVITAQKLYVLYDTQLLACCTPYMNQNSILKHCKTLQETVLQVLCYLSKFHIPPNKRCPASLTWVMVRGEKEEKLNGWDWKPLSL